MNLFANLDSQVTISLGQILMGATGAAILAVAAVLVLAINRSCDKGVVAGLFLASAGLTGATAVESQDYVPNPKPPEVKKEVAPDQLQAMQTVLKEQNAQYEKQREAHLASKANAPVPFWLFTPSVCLAIVGSTLVGWRWVAWCNGYLPREGGGGDGYRS